MNIPIEYNATVHPTLSSTSILFEKVGVNYRVPRERLTGMKEYFIHLIKRKINFNDFHALDKVSFEVGQGEVFGIIGRNGAGKSTALKLIARVLYPSTGRVVVRGFLAPLLELGAGFNYELTGRENIFLNSSLLGRTKKETEGLILQIIEFSEIGEFMESPIRTYSSGMVARLGFSVATALRPDILLVDEVLSVGDSKFQEKCVDRMNQFRLEGTTIIFVTHSMSTIKEFCDRVLWLDRGKMMAIGEASAVVNEYQKNWDQKSGG